MCFTVVCILEASPCKQPACTTFVVISDFAGLVERCDFLELHAMRTVFTRLLYTLEIICRYRFGTQQLSHL